MAHGAAEMQLLASAAAGAVVARPAIAGWEIVGWEMEPAHREAAIATYRAVVTADLARGHHFAHDLGSPEICGGCRLPTMRVTSRSFA